MIEKSRHGLKLSVRTAQVNSKPGHTTHNEHKELFLNTMSDGLGLWGDVPPPGVRLMKS